jgi:hypothetical protein
MFKFTDLFRVSKQMLADFGLPQTEAMIDSLIEAPESTLRELLSMQSNSPFFLGV